MKGVLLKHVGWNHHIRSNGNNKPWSVSQTIPEFEGIRLGSLWKFLEFDFQEVVGILFIGPFGHTKFGALSGCLGVL